MAEKVRYLNELKMTEIENEKDSILFLPVGISEGHGKHLPAGTDTFQAEYVVEEVCRRLDKPTLIAPTLNYGYCRATRHLSGTLSISFDSLKSVAFDILKSLNDQCFGKIVIVSGHAGSSHMTALKLAAEEVLEKSDIEILLLSDYDYAYELKGEDVPSTDGHGGEIETARLLDIREDLVGKDRPDTEVKYPSFKVMVDYSEYLSDGMRGNARKATKEEGREINEYVIEKIINLVEDTF